MWTLSGNVPVCGRVERRRGQGRTWQAGSALLARARALHSDANDVAATCEVRKSEARSKVKAVRAELVRRQLATIPVTRLRETTQGRLRLGPLEAAGYRTVADVASALPSRLEWVQGVGVQTASQTVAAARQLAAAVEESIAFRLDPDDKQPLQTDLLAALWAYEQAERLTSRLRDQIEDLSATLAPLVDEAARTGSRVKMFFGRTSRRTAAHDALQRLERLLGEPTVQFLHAALTDALAAFGRPLPDSDALWRDYETRASDYYALLGQLGDIDLDADAAQGFLAAEIAARVHAQELDNTLLKVSLRGYQAFGAKFALVQRRSILGDEMGLGKTIEAIAALAHLRSTGAAHFLVVCPASVLLNWTNEISRRSELLAHRVHGGRREVGLQDWTRQGGVAVTTFESLRALSLPEDVRIAMLVVDEAHYVKNPAALRSQAVSQSIAMADRVLFLTGTPMENRVEEFRNLVDYLQPQIATSVKHIDGVAGATAFRKAVAPVYLRRNQTDVLAELPERLEMQDWVEFGDDDFAAYRAAVASGNFMAMRRAAYAPGMEGSAKLTRLLEIVGESAANDWKVVVFSYFRDVLETIGTAIGPRVLAPLTGSVPPTRRQSLVDEFTACDGHAVLVSQIQAGGVGLNMQAASVVILAEPQWKPSSEEQAIARCHRMGQVRRVRVHRLLAKDSVDQRMLEILQTKASLFEEYVRQSDLKDASPDAIDVSDVESARDIVSEAEAQRRIIEIERERLGLTAQPL